MTENDWGCLARDLFYFNIYRYDHEDSRLPNNYEPCAGLRPRSFGKDGLVVKAG